MNRLTKGTTYLLLSIAVCSCMENNKSVTPLSGEWRIVEVNGKKATGENTPTIGFNPQDSMMYGCNSCNRFFGRIEYDKDEPSAISFPSVGTTMMMCANSPMEQEIQSAVNSVASFRYVSKGEVLLLDKDNTTLLLLSPYIAKEAQQ